MRTRCGAVRKRSTITIKNAFAAFCAHIRNLPPDSQLSKIRTLRLATQYIKFLMEILKENDRQETSTHKNNPDLPGGGNTESIVNLIAGYRVNNYLPIICSFFMIQQWADSEPEPRKQRTSTRWPQLIWERELRDCKWCYFDHFVP